jgi:DNA-binding NtrC family response regulator
MSGQGSGGILLVDDEPLPVQALSRELGLRGWTVRMAQSGTEALARVNEQPSDAVLVDWQMPGMDGIALIEELRAKHVPAAFFLMSGHLDTAVTVRAMRAGAHDVFEKPLNVSALDACLRTVLASKAPPLSSAARGRMTSSPILGDAPAIRAVREQVRTVARYRDLPVLITGETGTGKELVAQAVHAASETDGPFVPVNCAAIPESLFESELFGHDAGSFTGARAARAGLFEVAAEGTLFLDEIGELPSALQPKLLRALETRTFRRVGGNRDLPFRARVISATHRPLTGADASLRNDLYYRLAGFTIATPSLRDRALDIDMLAQHFLREFRTRYGVDVEFSPRALEALHAYDWPGNVRELRAVVQQAAVLSGGDRVGVGDLMAALRNRQERPTQTHSETFSVVSVLPEPLHAPARSEPLRVLERRTIVEAWESSGQNLSAAARVLGLPRTTLRDRLRKYGMR